MSETLDAVSPVSAEVRGQPEAKPARRAGGIGIWPLVIVTALIFGFLAITKPNFFTYTNIYGLLYEDSIAFLVVLGFTYVMVLREIDLSVGSVYAFSGVLTGYLLLDGLPLWGAVAIALTGAAFIGFINGWLVVRLRLNSLMLTIGTMLMVRGIVGVMTTTLRGNIFPRDFRMLSRARYFDVNTTILAMAVLVVAALVFQWRSVLFRQMCYIGENMQSAVIYGVRAGRIKIVAFMVSAVLAGVAGIYTASRITHGDVNMGMGLEFTMVTAAVLGGASLYGGKGNVAGSALGLFLLSVILNGMLMYDIEPVFQQFVIGLLLILTVGFDTLVARRNRIR